MAAKAPTTSCHVEVERKFDVVESTLSPSFAGMTPISRVEGPPPQTLEAVYFDTPARDLAARRITLRRRTGGTDAGWHLKLPAGPDARTEIHAPLTDADGDGVPAEVLDPVLAIVRDRPLRALARIATSRKVNLLYGSDDAVLAEFCDDEVSARVGEHIDESAVEQRWREWELELVGPDATTNTELLDRLSTRLFDAGAAPAQHRSKLARALGTAAVPEPPARPADPIRRAVAEQLDELLLWDRAMRSDAEDSVHQMRVVIRKIRGLLQASPDAFGLTEDGSDSWILDDLRELGRLLGKARDAEVLAERYQRALDRLPPELVRGPVRERLVDGVRDGYRTGREQALTMLRSERYFRLLDGLDELVAGPPSQRAGKSVPAVVGTAYKGVREAAKAAAKAAEEERDDALHRIRKRAKRLRYTASATGADKVAKRAKDIQTLLGDHQDSVVSRAHLPQFADEARQAGEDTFTYGLLYQQEAELARNSRGKVGKALRKLDKAVRKTQ